MPSSPLGSISPWLNLIFIKTLKLAMPTFKLRLDSKHLMLFSSSNGNTLKDHNYNIKIDIIYMTTLLFNSTTDCSLIGLN